jgi:integrase
MIALGWYQEAKQKTVTGKSITKISFQKLARTYLGHIKTLGKHKFHYEIMNRHFLPFFSKFDDISKLRTADIQDYMTYRRRKSSVLPQSINRENTVLRQALYFAEKREWLPNLVHIEHLNERLTRKRRSHFTIEEYLRLCHTAIRRIKELKDIPLQTTAYRQRQLLFDYIKFLANSGVRVDESKAINWRHVDLERKTVIIENSGKNKQLRTVLVRPTGIIALRRLKERRLGYLKKLGIDSIDPNEPIFSTENGKPVLNFKKGFNALLTSSGFEYPDRTKKHTLTSLRHSYATFRLTTTRAKRASIKALSVQMGTSIRMIEKYYGHDQIHDYEEEFAGLDED